MKRVAASTDSAASRVLQRLRRRNTMLMKALQESVWRDRAQFPDNPFCYFCGAGKNWAKDHGHQRQCPIAKGSA